MYIIITTSTYILTVYTTTYIYTYAQPCWSSSSPWAAQCWCTRPPAPSSQAPPYSNSNRYGIRDSGSWEHILQCSEYCFNPFSLTVQLNMHTDTSRPPCGSDIYTGCFYSALYIPPFLLVSTHYSAL